MENIEVTNIEVTSPCQVGEDTMSLNPWHGSSCELHGGEDLKPAIFTTNNETVTIEPSVDSATSSEPNAEPSVDSGSAMFESIFEPSVDPANSAELSEAPATCAEVTDTAQQTVEPATAVSTLEPSTTQVIHITARLCTSTGTGASTTTTLCFGVPADSENINDIIIKILQAAPISTIHSVYEDVVDGYNVVDVYPSTQDVREDNFEVPSAKKVSKWKRAKKYLKQLFSCFG